MSTIVGVETDDGTLLAGDRIHVEGGVKVGDSVRRVFDFEDVGAAAVGAPGSIDEFGRRLEAEVREYRIEHDDPMGIDRLARTAAGLADSVDVDAVVSTRDDEGVARLRTVGSDGSVLSDSPVAFGSGAQLAIGQLEGTDLNDDLDDVEETVRDLFSSIAERDSGTGAEIDVWTLESTNRD